MGENSLLEDSFIQYKCSEYTIGEYYNKYNAQSDLGRTVTIIKAVNPNLYTPINISLEATIQRLTNEKLPKYNDENFKEARSNLALQLTKDYGPLYLPRHIQKINNDIELNRYVSLFPESIEEFKENYPYDGEEVGEWLRLVETVQYALNRIKIPNFNKSMQSSDAFFHEEQIQLYLNEVNPVYDFDKETISLKCDSIASAIMLYIVSNKRRLKSCEVCSKLFYAKRSNAQYCNTTCGRKNQGDRKANKT
jgi:hypothetical protein